MNVHLLCIRTVVSANVTYCCPWPYCHI